MRVFSFLSRVLGIIHGMQPNRSNRSFNLRNLTNGFCSQIVQPMDIFFFATLISSREQKVTCATVKISLIQHFCWSTEGCHLFLCRGHLVWLFDIQNLYEQLFCVPFIIFRVPVRPQLKTVFKQLYLDMDVFDYFGIREVNVKPPISRNLDTLLECNLV